MLSQLFSWTYCSCPCLKDRFTPFNYLVLALCLPLIAASASVDADEQIFQAGARPELLDSNGRKVEGVYRIDLDGRVTRITTHEVDRPNGLVVTPDDKHLYVADNNNNTVGGARKLWRFDLKADGTVDLATQKLIYDWKTTRGPDGMKLDAAGRLFVAAGANRQNPPFETQDKPTAGIYVFSPAGELLDFIPIPRDET